MASEEDKTIMMGGGGADGQLAADESEIKPPRSKLVCLDDTLLDPSQKGLEILLIDREVTLGRGQDNTNPIKYQKISRNHARIRPVSGKWVIEDLNSTNGVWVNETRTKEARMRPGDYVKIGVVPFQFGLERPTAVALPTGVSGGEDDGEGTLMFGSQAAANRMIEVEVEQQQAEPEKPTKRQDAPLAPTPSDTDSSPVKSRKRGKRLGLIFGLIVVVAIGGFMFLKPGGDTGEKELRAQTRAIKQFADDFEMTQGSPSIQEIKSQIQIIAGYALQAEQSAAKFPENEGFQNLRARILFLRIERKLRILIKQKRADEATSMVQSAIREAEELKKGWRGKKLRMVDDVLNMLALAETVTTIKRFRQRFHEPSRHVEKKPTKDEMQAVLKVQKAFVKQKKNPKINVTLSVQFPFFSKMVTGVDEEDLPALDQWREITR